MNATSSQSNPVSKQAVKYVDRQAVIGKRRKVSIRAHLRV